MANLPLAFGELLAGSILLVSGVTGSSPADTINGRVTMHPLPLPFGGSSGGSSTSSGSSAGGGSAPSIQAAAQKYGVPAGILMGVYGMETSYGADVTTSSAGAKGSFQFIQSTAAQYHYPYTNATDPGTFGQQVDAAAHYLSDLFHQTGSWDAAVRSYSGGGYGLAEVAAKSKGLPT